MKKNLISTLLIVFLVIFISCSNSSTSYESEMVRIALASPYNDKVEARVYIEGLDGNIVTGAVVSVKDSANSITILNYNFQQGCYYGLVNKASGGEYTFTVNSRLFKTPKEYIVPHLYLENTIDIKKIEMLNQIGESYQNYDTFNTSLPIRITWPSSVENCTYKITIKTPAKVLYEVSTNNKTIEIPANTIPAGTNYVYLQIQQQKLYGDILFQNANYYSVSVYSTGSINFNVY